MPTSPDDQRRIDLLQAELSDLGLEWHVHYRLVNKGERWVLHFTRTTTPTQSSRALELVEMIMNR